MQTDTLSRELMRIATRIYGGVDTPLSKIASKAIENKDWDGLAKLSASPRCYSDALSYFKDAAAASFVKKLKDLPNSDDRRSKAIEKWKEAEAQCYRTNLRMTEFLEEYRNLGEGPNPRVVEFIDGVRRIILAWIGPRPPAQIIEHARFGPGATFVDKGSSSTPAHKMQSDPSLTSGLIWFLPQWLETKWGQFAAKNRTKLDFIPGNRFTTVPKTSLIDRAISIEPSLNVFFQLALGRVLRKRLLSNAGWDLDHAQEVHKRVACEASRTREHCTLDLSSASDTVCKNLVRILLPHQWFDQLNDLRSKKTLLDGRWVMLEKFSSMGNGYTFELETIIFAAISCQLVRSCGHKGVLGEDVYVFGDDIIVPDDCYAPLCRALEYFGFSINLEKSFAGDIPFRESCGGDYWDGSDVRPIFLKESPRGPQDYIVLSNQITLLRERFEALGFDLDRRCWFAALDCLPIPLRNLRGPKALGDQVIWDRDGSWKYRYKDSIRYVRGLQAKPSKRSLVPFGRFHPDIVLACATYGTGGGDVGGLFPRSPDLSYKVAWVAFS